MWEAIDVATDTSHVVERLKLAGVQTVIRYYYHQNSGELPNQALSVAEAARLTEAGLSLAVVFRQRAMSLCGISDLEAENGRRDAARALELAREIQQPQESAIYFTVDHDYFRVSELAQVRAYFATIRTHLDGRYLVGCYSSGTVGRDLKSAGLVDHIWLAGAKGWSGTRAMLGTDRWSLFKKDLSRTLPDSDFRFDGNIVNPAFPNFGQFNLAAAPPTPAVDKPSGSATLMEVTARSGLQLRSGPGANFDRVTAVPMGGIVEALGKMGDWIEVDLQGDGATDGYMHGGFLRVISGGFPIDVPAARTPLEVARAELQRDVKEVPGTESNPRIVLYHSTTHGGPAPDRVPWCSSFVNYCVEQAGLAGTDSKWAKSWHESGWGRNVSEEPEEGDIAVFERREGSAQGAPRGGHVGFWLGEQAGQIRLLGGNQSDRVRISTYPKAGSRGSSYYHLLSIRRG